MIERLAAPPVFVVGIPRSGTTWVYDVLDAHPQVCAVFESGLFDSTRGFGGVLSRDGWRWNTNSDKHVAPRTYVVDELRAFADRVLAHHMQPHHRYLVEKTPGHVLALPVLVEVFPDAKIVHVVRDGRDVAVSAIWATQTWAAGRWRRVPPPRDVALQAKRWASAMAATHIAKSMLDPSRFLEMRYEDLKTDAKGQIRRLLTFCGFEFDEELVVELTDRTDFQKSGRAADPSGFYRAGRVGDWQSSFTVFDALAFNAYGGQALVTAGYERSRRWLPAGLRLRRARRSAATGSAPPASPTS
jgi:hypothetical protein